MSVEKRVADLEARYEKIERRFTVASGSPALAEAVQFQSNRSRRVHRWFHFKEGFSAELFTALQLGTESLNDKDSVFLDPFCGSGTTIVAGDLEYSWRARRVGVEINPFLAFMAQTKASWRDYSPWRLMALAAEVTAEPFRHDVDPAAWPALSSLHNEEIFAPERVSALVDAVNRIQALAQRESELLLLGVGSAAERLGFFRRDGRALRILRSNGEREVRRQTSVSTVLVQTWQAFADDLRALQGRRDCERGDGVVICGDGRVLELPEEMGIREGDVHLIAYSPPYLNHIDYTEIYKVELWLLGFLRKTEEMLDLRKRTLRSHGSIGVARIENALPESIRECVELASSIVASTGKKWHRSFPRLAEAYLADLRTSLERQFTLLRRGGGVVCVVGNSAHGSKEHRIPVAVDLLIAALAESIGFDVERLVVARQLRRRDHINRFLRETALVLRRPEI